MLQSASLRDTSETGADNKALYHPLQNSLRLFEKIASQTQDAQNHMYLYLYLSLQVRSGLLFEETWKKTKGSKSQAPPEFQSKKCSKV